MNWCTSGRNFFIQLSSPRNEASCMLDRPEVDIYSSSSFINACRVGLPASFARHFADRLASRFWARRTRCSSFRKAIASLRVVLAFAFSFSCSSSGGVLAFGGSSSTFTPGPGREAASTPTSPVPTASSASLSDGPGLVIRSLSQAVSETRLADAPSSVACSRRRFCCGYSIGLSLGAGNDILVVWLVEFAFEEGVTEISSRTGEDCACS
ncbi:hypothetical protein GALMADRAFT_1130415 [Galerina marginata CBS 339.88]|uniref:Uncharacterized protein n=1 Tax=Galerina marginata (strain CBS 339.88) TaxID=685588 RepID=A0A067S8I2_GALM3|nr:hypothetical protein GALMADRAFT_1130415 [Galerina marginata CBS 339.88]